MHRDIRFASLLLAAAVACGKTSGTTEPLAYTMEQAADSLPVALGKSIVIDRYLVSFHDVSSDSRCPARVVCVWAGDAVARFGVTLACVRSTPACAVPEIQLDLHTGVEPRSGSYAGTTLRLMSLQPYPETAGSIRKDQYIAWIRLTPAS